jgi:hypothetical protein
MGNNLTLTPRELSEMALARIANDPKSWDQGAWHCGTSHCYAGHVDIILGVPNGYLEEENEDEDGYSLEIGLFHNVQDALGLDFKQYLRITDANNSLSDLHRYHKEFFLTGAAA